MRSLLSFVALGIALSASAQANQKILDCNLGFGDIAQIVIYRSQDGYVSSLLTNTGRFLAGPSFNEAVWQSKMIRFEYRGYRYEFYSRDQGRHWSYMSYPGSSTSPDTIGSADCD